MSLLPVITVLLPVLGAGGLLALAIIPRLRPYLRYLALAVVILSLAAVIALRWTEPTLIIPSLWRPSPLLGSAPAVQSDPLAQPLALAMELVTLAAVLVELGRRSESHIRLTAAMLALLSAALVTIWSANIVSTIISWAVYDLVYAIGHIAAGGSARTGLRGLVMGNLATLLLWMGTLLPGGGTESALWALMTPDEAQLTLWMVAGVLRLWVYPFHLPAPDDLDTARPLAALLLLGPVVGWRLWLHLITTTGGTFPTAPWLTALAALSLSVGGFLAWTGGQPACLLSCIGVAATGGILLAATLAGEQSAAVIVSGSVAWTLALGLLFLRPDAADVDEGDRRRLIAWYGPALIGALTLLGFPATPGFFAVGLLAGRLTLERAPALLAAFLTGTLFLVPSLVRWLRGKSPAPLPLREWRWGMRSLAPAVGVGGMAALTVAAGLYPALLLSPSPFALKDALMEPRLTDWLLWIISLAGGGILAWQERNIRRYLRLPLTVLHDLLRLEWLYAALAGALDKGVGMLRTADEIVEGAGALLWSWLLFLLVLLLTWRM